MKWLVIVLLCSQLSCSKDSESLCFPATVTWGGEPAADGLGWHLRKDSTGSEVFIPDNLSNEFKQDGLVVDVCLVRTKELFYCQCVQPMKVYHITSIKRR